MAEGQPDFRPWLRQNGLSRFFEGLKNEGFDEVAHIAGCTEKDLRELAVTLNMKAGHRTRLLLAAQALPASRSAIVAPKLVVIEKEESEGLSKLHTMKQRVAQKLTEVETRTRDVDKSVRVCRQEVSKAFEILASLVEERKTQLISEIDKEASKKLQGLQAQKTSLKHSAKELEKIDKTCSQMFERSDWNATKTRKQQLLANVDDATKTLKKVENMEITTVLKFVSQKSSVNKAVREFGSLIGIDGIVPPKITSLDVKAKSVEVSWKDQNRFCEAFEISLGLSDEKDQSVDNMKISEFAYSSVKTEAKLTVQPERHYLMKMRSRTAVGWGAYSEAMLFDTPAEIIFPGTTLLDDKSSVKLIEFLDGLKPLSLLYKASVHGFAASSFHSHCDHKGPTVVVIKRNGSERIFGGYTPLNWYQSKRGNVRDDEMRSFVFAMSDDNGRPAKFKHQNNPQFAIYCTPNSGPKFAGGHVIDICNNSNTTTGNQTNGNETYGVPSNTTLCGQFNGYTIDEIEVFKVA